LYSTFFNFTKGGAQTKAIHTTQDRFGTVVSIAQSLIARTASYRTGWSLSNSAKADAKTAEEAILIRAERERDARNEDYRPRLLNTFGCGPMW
jgi:hypothetical protein